MVRFRVGESATTRGDLDANPKGWYCGRQRPSLLKMGRNDMRTIDMKTWHRRMHFEVYNAFDYPHFNLCAPVDVTDFYRTVKEEGVSLTIATTYILATVANLIPEFRTRIRGEQVVEHDVVHPSITILRDDEMFSFCYIEFVADFQHFTMVAQERIDHVKQYPTLEDEPGQDDLLYMTSIPWVAFTNIMHPIHMHPIDSVPRIAWGKIFEDGSTLKMPLSVQGHHGLMDGLHVGRYYEQVQEMLRDPAQISST
jgi:chloramphenicol O-acetyltransferase type A